MKKKPQIDIGLGDLVHHVLMDEAWLGVVIKIEEQVRKKRGEDKKTPTHRTVKAFVHIVSDHCFPEIRLTRNQNLGSKFGWVDVAWLKVKNKA
jgi:hypothetical protein